MNEERLQRVLVRGGIGVRTAGGLAIFRTRDLRSRPVGCFPQARFEDLMAANMLVRQELDDREIYTWNSRQLPLNEGDPHRWSGRPPGPPTSARRGRSVGRFLDHLTRDDVPGGDRRQAATARFLAEAEHASTSPAVTMNWRGLAEGRISGGRHKDHPVPTGGRARQNLAILTRRLGFEDMRWLEGLIIAEWSGAKFMRKIGITKQADARAKAMELLDRLADAYDQCVPRM